MKNDDNSKMSEGSEVVHLNNDFVTNKDLTIALLNFKAEVEKNFNDFKLDIQKIFNELERKIDKIDIKFWLILVSQGAVFSALWWLITHVATK